MYGLWTKNVSIINEICLCYDCIMYQLCIYYYHFELIDLGVLNTFKFRVLVYSLCTCYVICIVNYVHIMNIHNELWIFIMHYGFP